MTDVDRIAANRGQQAQREWAEVEAAFDRVREAILNNLAETSPAMPDKVLKLHMSVQNLTAVRQAVFDVINNGAYAQQALASAGLTRPN